MKAYRALVDTQFRSQLREPVGLFFGVVFAPVLVLVLGLFFGNEPNPDFGGRGFVDATLPGFASVALAVTGVMMLPMNQLTLRESGALRRLRLTPLRPATYIAADLTVNFVVGIVGMCLALGVGAVVFGARPSGNLLLILAAAALGLVAFLALGYTLSGLYPSQGAAVGIGNVLMILLMLTSGAFIPLAILPDGVQAAMRVSPIHYFVELLQGLWDGTSWSLLLLPTGVLAGMVVVFGLLGARLFRWDRS